MFDKAFSNNTMDYELIFWGYTFAIKKITWFAQVLSGQTVDISCFYTFQYPELQLELKNSRVEHS